MFIEYDTEREVLYLKICKGKIVKTKEYRPDVFIDVNKEGHLLGIEILDSEDCKYFPKIAKKYSLHDINRMHPRYLKKVLV